MDILCEDGPLIAVNKPAGMICQGAPPGVASLIDEVKKYLKQKYAKPGNVYLGVVHRLDRPVSGVVVFSRNSKCAARLAKQFREREVQKVYLAAVSPAPQPPEGVLVDWLRRIEGDVQKVDIVPAGAAGSQEATLTYRTLQRRGPIALLEIELGTGRMHQIRVQLAGRGWPIVGDGRYGSKIPFGSRNGDEHEQAIALHAHRLTLRHPIRYDEVVLTAPLPPMWRELGF
jgi:23S rRNA pseudouridine1911/1915/1917 synthase